MCIITQWGDEMIENLFGETVPEMIPHKNTFRLSKYQLFKRKFNYMESRNENGCKNCKYHLVKEYHGKRYHKCEQLGTSHSSATDIRLKCICNLWIERIR